MVPYLTNQSFEEISLFNFNLSKIIPSLPPKKLEKNFFFVGTTIPEGIKFLTLKFKSGRQIIFLFIGLFFNKHFI